MSKPKVNPVVQQLTQQIAQANLGTNKKLININGRVNSIETNSNSQITYALPETVKLEVGDKVTLFQAFLNEQGLNVDTIQFQEDQEVELVGLYYMLGDTQSNNTSEGNQASDMSFGTFPDFYRDCVSNANSSGNGQNRKCYIPSNDSNDCFANGGVDNKTVGYSYRFEDIVGFLSTNNTIATGDKVDEGRNMKSYHNGAFKGAGANGHMHYLVETARVNIMNDANGQPINTYKNWVQNGTPKEKTGELVMWRPCYMKTSVKIPANNYSVAKLADLIQEQLSGSLDPDFQDNSTEEMKLYYPTKYGRTGNDKANTTPFFNDLTNNNVQADPIVNGDADFYKADYKRKYGKFSKTLRYGKGNNQTDLSAQGLTNLDFLNDRNYVPPNSVSGITEDIGVAPANRIFLNGAYMNDLKFLAPRDFELDTETFSVNHYVPASQLYWTNRTFWSTGNFKSMEFELGVRYKHGSPEPLVPSNDTVNVDDAFMVNSFLVPLATAITQFADVSAPPTKFAGTTAFTFQYDPTLKNRFTFSNLHEPFKLPSLSADAKETNFGGQQATKYNNVYSSGTGANGQSTNNPYKVGNFLNPIYPIDCVSGVMITNFAFNFVKDTQIYKDKIANINAFTVDNNIRYGENVVRRESAIFELYTTKFHSFFPNADEAKKVWDTTLWSKMGFPYEQLGDISNQIEERFSYGGWEAYNPTTKVGTIRPPISNYGLITHNDFDYTNIISSCGLGAGNPIPPTTAGVPSALYQPQSYYLGSDLPNDIGINENSFHILSTSREIAALDLPNLNTGGYYIIESDIVKPNSMEAQGQQSTIVGIMSKQMSSNDTIYSAEGLEFTITEEKLLSQINISVRNPDGTLVPSNILGNNSGFIFVIEKPIEPADMTTNSL